MKLSLILLIFISVAAYAHTTETVLEPGYGYKTESLAPETKTESLQEVTNIAPVSETKSESTVAPAEPAHATPATPDFYKMECTHATLFHAGIPADKLCDVAQHICSGDFANFYSIFYCSMNGSWVGFMVFVIIVIFLIFKYTAIVVDEYIVPGLTNVSESLKLSESLAAVTLLALANGAGDVITALVSGSGSGGVSYNIGALYGAGLFVAVCVVSICIFNDKNKSIGFDPMIIYRDIGTYLIATVLTILFALVGYVYWWMAVIFLIVYVLYVLFVYIYEKRCANAEKNATVGNEMTAPPKVGSNAIAGGEEKVNLTGNLLGNLGTTLARAHRPIHALGNYMLAKKATKEFKHMEKKNTMIEEEEVTGAMSKFMGELCEWVDVPYVFICKLTCLPSNINEEEWEAWKFYCYPLTGVFWAHWVFTGEFVNASLLYVALPICIVLYLVEWAGLRHGISKAAMGPSERLQVVIREKRKNGTLEINAIIALLVETKMDEESDTRLTWFQWVTSVMGVCAGLMWTYVLVGFLIDMLNCFGVLLGLDNTYLGLTILAVGNALPDALTTISLVAKGNATMAIAGGYAGQLFGLLIGFGLAQLKTTIISGPQLFDLFNPANLAENLLDLLVVGTALFALLVTFVWGITHKTAFVDAEGKEDKTKSQMNMTRAFAIIVSVVYVAFLIGCSVLAISKAIANF